MVTRRTVRERARRKRMISTNYFLFTFSIGCPQDGGWK